MSKSTPHRPIAVLNFQTRMTIHKRGFCQKLAAKTGKGVYLAKSNTTQKHSILSNGGNSNSGAVASQKADAQHGRFLGFVS
jgi:hypothetical protein